MILHEISVTFRWAWWARPALFIATLYQVAFKRPQNMRVLNWIAKYGVTPEVRSRAA